MEALYIVIWLSISLCCSLWLNFQRFKYYEKMIEKEYREKYHKDSCNLPELQKLVNEMELLTSNIKKVDFKTIKQWRYNAVFAKLSEDFNKKIMEMNEYRVEQP